MRLAISALTQFKIANGKKKKTDKEINIHSTAADFGKAGEALRSFLTSGMSYPLFRAMRDARATFPVVKKAALKQAD